MRGLRAFLLSEIGAWTLFWTLFRKNCRREPCRWDSRLFYLVQGLHVFPQAHLLRYCSPYACFLQSNAAGSMKLSIIPDTFYLNSIKHQGDAFIIPSLDSRRQSTLTVCILMFIRQFRRYLRIVTRKIVNKLLTYKIRVTLLPIVQNVVSES